MQSLSKNLWHSLSNKARMKKDLSIIQRWLVT